jgi:hypothetical protein
LGEREERINLKGVKYESRVEQIYSDAGGWVQAGTHLGRGHVPFPGNIPEK